MAVFNKIQYIFSEYTNTSEKKVGKYFAKLNEHSSKRKTFAKLAGLMLQDIVVFNLWAESKYKGYDYLNKRKRQELYSNTQAIMADFNDYILKNSHLSSVNIISEINQLGINTNDLKDSLDELIYLKNIMNYLALSRGVYKYRESSTFGELLKDPSNNQLVGDCNQIVTLYIYLYSLKYNVTDLQLKTYPGHVALHFKGVDIEATNGQFKHYQKDNQKILPIQEIISINLLDTTDAYFKTHKVKPQTFLQAARLASLISSEQDIVNNNLAIAYNNIVAELLKSKNYSLALKYAKQSRDKQLIELVGYNGAVFFMGNNQFLDALKYAEYSKNKNDLVPKIYYNQGVMYYKNGEYLKAIKAFKQIGSNDLIKQCYIGLYNVEQNKLGKIKTTADIKQNKKTIINMSNYAKKSQNKKLIEHTSSLSKYL